MSGDFYRIDTTGTNSSADWDWKFLETNLAMACGVAVDDKRIYISGGFHMHSKSALYYCRQVVRKKEIMLCLALFSKNVANFCCSKTQKPQGVY